MTTELTLLSGVAYRGREVTSPRLRALLALLAEDLHRGCSTTRLMDGLWPEDQPQNPTKALQVLISRLRAQLGADLITTTATGYRLSLGEDQVDAAAVLRCAADSARHTRAGDHAAALTSAEAGLALWDGAADHDAAADDGLLEDPLTVLHVQRASIRGALERDRALALARLGRRAEALAPLTALRASNPLDEEIVLELLRCEAAVVGSAAALARYDTHRRALREELGTDPGDALQAEHRQLLRGAVPVVRQGVAHDPNPLVGRATDVTAVAELLRRARVVSVVGPGGLGKTRLASVVGRQAEQRAVHLVPLAGVTSDDDVVGEVASVLGIGEIRQTSIVHTAIPPDVLGGILKALSPGPTLLVLDNCEHVIAGAAALVRALVALKADLAVLTTSRAPLGLTSESVYHLPALDLPAMVELFGQRARAARPGVDLPAEVVEELCDRLDGLPLACELAAARVRVMSVTEIAGRLQDRFALLRGTARDVPQRHRTLHAVVEWSWNLLAETGQGAMRALSIFPGGFTADAAHHLLDAAGLLNGDDALDILVDLVDQSLLQITDTPAGARFRMLETVREFSAGRRSSGETEQVLDGFLTWARAFGMAHQESVLAADVGETLPLLRAEQDNLVLALRHGLDRGDGATVAAASAVLAGLWMIVESNYVRMAALVDEAAGVLARFRPDPAMIDVTRAAATLFTAYAFLIEGPRAVRSLVVLRRLPPASPNSLIGAIAIVLARAPELLGPDRGPLHRLAAEGDPLVAAVASAVLTYRCEQEGELEEALAAARRMLDVFDECKTLWTRILAHSRTAELCLQLELGEESRDHLRAALQVQEQLGVPVDEVGLRLALVLATMQTGAVDEAARLLDTVLLEQEEEVGNVTFGLAVRAEILHSRGEVAAGLALWRDAWEQLTHPAGPIFGVAAGNPAIDPWLLEVQAVTVIAHATHGRLDLVSDLVDDLPGVLIKRLSDPPRRPPPFVLDFAVNGTLLMALAMVDLDHGRRTGERQAIRSGVGLVVLAERFRFLKGFQPTMSSTRLRELAQQADREAYTAAVSACAAIDRDGLRAAAIAAVQARQEWLT